ncbi:response regulator transcription factor [Methylophaga sp.]|jgi:DNA-binding NarL/FixJ family response regulator|uniref:response regulator n=1 Tax=Methylophaga sp. TaxID=2024840 RepID=UPI0013FEC74D|nr:response regulator transcription factor [Methylophaga sp.]MTI64915.1 response regulator transcription factor [Methylophaga sp.]
MTKVILVDDHVVVRSGVKRLLEEQPDLQVVAEADTGDDAYKLYHQHQPDVLLMDMNMADTSGLATLGQIKARFSDAKIIMFTSRPEVVFAIQAISAGAKGYVLKSSTAEEVILAVRQVASGKSYLSSEVAQAIALQNLSAEEDPTRSLTPREFEIFRLLAEGADIDTIADTLKIGQKTVANYQTQLKHKLNIHTPIQLVRLAVKHQIIRLQ